MAILEAVHAVQPTCLTAVCRFFGADLESAWWVSAIGASMSMGYRWDFDKEPKHVFTTNLSGLHEHVP